MVFHNPCKIVDPFLYLKTYFAGCLPGASSLNEGSLHPLLIDSAIYSGYIQFIDFDSMCADLIFTYLQRSHSTAQHGVRTIYIQLLEHHLPSLLSPAYSGQPTEPVFQPKMIDFW